jgi:hypothetical protein
LITNVLLSYRDTDSRLATKDTKKASTIATPIICFRQQFSLVEYMYTQKEATRKPQTDGYHSLILPANISTIIIPIHDVMRRGCRLVISKLTSSRLGLVKAVNSRILVEQKCRLSFDQDDRSRQGRSFLQKKIGTTFWKNAVCVQVGFGPDTYD